jgi:hypothetical protein
MGGITFDDCGITDKTKVGAHSWRHRATSGPWLAATIPVCPLKGL